MDYYESKGISPSAAFFILLGLMGAGLLVGGVAGVGVWMAMTGKGIYSLQTELMNPLYVNAARWMQVISVLFMFFFPALIVARLIDRRPLRWLGFFRGFNSRQFILVVLILAACMPLVGALGELNQAIPLTRNLEQAVKKMEENYTTQATALATMRSFPEFIFSLIVMALLPAVFEETFFRGGIQQILLGWFKSPLAAILITSILFSAMHISWFGFLPRFALGMVLGYIFYYSKSIWLNMVLHFLNNGIAVTYMYYLWLQHKPVKDAMDDNAPLWMGLPAIIAVVLLMRYFKQVSQKHNIDQVPPMDGPSVFTSTLV